MRISRDICAVLWDRKVTKGNERTEVDSDGAIRLFTSAARRRDSFLNRLLTRAGLLVAIFRNHL